MSQELTREQCDLLEKGILILRDKITGDTLDYFELAMIKLAAMGNPNIEIWFASPGGDADIGLCVYDIVRLYPGVVTGHVMSYAYSSAAIILLACDYVTGHPASLILFHNTSFTRTHDYDEIKKGILPAYTIKIANDPQKRFVDIVKAATGMSLRETRKFLRDERMLSAIEAKKMGFLDEIL